MKLKDETHGMSEKEYQYYLECIEENKAKTDYGARLENKKDIEDYGLKSYIHKEDRYKENMGGLEGLFNREVGGKNPVIGWVIIVMCIIMFFIWSERGVRAVRELSVDSVIVKGTVISTEKKSELVRSGKHSRLETYYYITYEWVGDNDMRNVNTKKTKDPAHPLAGNEIDVTVHADNHNIEINSKEHNKKVAPGYFCFSMVWVAIGIFAYIRHIKE